MEHDFYTTGDTDAPAAIKDRHGEVVLSLCRRCGQGEGDLEKFCQPNALALIRSVREALMWSAEGRQWWMRGQLAMAERELSAVEPRQRTNVLDDLMGEYGFAVPQEAYKKLQEALGSAPPTQEFVPEALPDFLRWCADELESRDKRAGSFASGVAQSLRGRASILETVDARKALHENQ